MAGVQFNQLLYSGAGITGRTLGRQKLLGFFLNAVELQFDINATTRTNYSKLTARQWAGPERHWIKRGSPLGAPWTALGNPPGAGADDPDPNNVKDNGSTLAYFDSPGPSPGAGLYAGASRINVIQNFTGWIEGISRASGQPERLCEVAAWFSVVDIANGNWDGSNGANSAWDFVALTTAGTGWRDVRVAPTI